MNNYPDLITATEKKFGFQKIQMETGYGNIFGGSETTDVWAYKINKSDYFFKTGEGQYKQMRYGYRANSRNQNPEWHPVGNDFESTPKVLPKITLEDTDFLIIVGIEYGDT